MQTTSLFGQLVGGPTESSESVPSLNVADTSQQQNALSFADVLASNADTTATRADGTLDVSPETLHALGLSEQPLLEYEAAGFSATGIAVSQDGAAEDVPLADGAHPQFIEGQTATIPHLRPTEIASVVKPIVLADQTQQASARNNQNDASRHVAAASVDIANTEDAVQLDAGRLAFVPALSNKSAATSHDPSRTKTATETAAEIGEAEAKSADALRHPSPLSGNFIGATSADALTDETQQPLPNDIVSNPAEFSTAHPFDLRSVGAETRLPAEDSSQVNDALGQHHAVTEGIVRQSALVPQVDPVLATTDQSKSVDLASDLASSAQLRDQIASPIESEQELAADVGDETARTQSTVLANNTIRSSSANPSTIQNPESGLSQLDHVAPQQLLADKPVDALSKATAVGDGLNPGASLPEHVEVSPQVQASTDSASQSIATNIQENKVGQESQPSFDESGEQSDNSDSSGEQSVRLQADETVAGDLPETFSSQQSSLETQTHHASPVSPVDVAQSVNGTASNNLPGADAVSLEAAPVVPNVFSSNNAPAVEQSSLSSAIAMPEGVDRVEVTNRVVGAISQLAETTDSQAGNVISLELEPAELGRLSIRVEQSAEMITAQIIASESVSSELLQSQKSALLESLNDLGFEIADVDISHKEERDSDSNPDSNSNSSKRQNSFAGTVDEADSPIARTAESSGLNIVA